MSKYIDAGKLISEIKGIIAAVQTKNHPDALGTMEQCLAAAEIEVLNLVLDDIKELQQEHLEVDLEKEIDAVWNPRFNLGWNEKSLLSINHSAFETIARHFYELGLNARKK